MEMLVSQTDGVTKAALSGRLDTQGAGKVELRFTTAIVPPGGMAIVDLSEVSFLASLGVRMFISTARALSRKGGRMVLFGATEPVMEIIQTMSLDDLIPVVATEDEALALVRG